MPRKKGNKKGRQANKNPHRPRPLSPKPLQPNAAPDKTTEDGEELWELNEVVASRFMYGKLYYQVSWKGWSKDEYWYPASDLKRCPHLLVEFHSDNPKAAGPPRRIDIWDKAWTEFTEEGLEKHEEDDMVMTAAQKKTWLEEFEDML